MSSLNAGKVWPEVSGQGNTSVTHSWQGSVGNLVRRMAGFALLGPVSGSQGECGV